MKTSTYFYIFTLCSLMIHSAAGLNILISFMHISVSHKKSFVPLALELARRGHNVTFFNTFVDLHVDLPKSVHQVDIVVKSPNPLYRDTFEYQNDTSFMSRFLMYPFRTNPAAILKLPWVISSHYCEHAIRQKPDEIGQIATSKWDLIIIDDIFSPCGYLIAKSSNAPFILHTTSYTYESTFLSRGLRIPIGVYPPQVNLWGYDENSFYWRLKAVHIVAMFRYANYMISQVVRKTVGSVAPMMAGFDDAEWQKHASFVLGTVGPMMDFPRPGTFDMKFHNPVCSTSASKLSREISEFVNDGSSKGTIICAFGHAVDYNSLPDWLVTVFYNAFFELNDYRIVWQYNGPQFYIVPSHMKIMEWIPQPALLAHSNTVAVITHGGFKSTAEILCAGLPAVIIPFRAEQATNAKLLAERFQMGVALDKLILTPDMLKTAVDIVSTNSTYRHNAGSIAEKLRDQIMDQLEYDAFNVEFASRHLKDRDVYALKCVDMNALVFYSLDVIICMIVTSVVSILFEQLMNRSK